MKVITLDFETFYDKDFSLSKITMEEYLRDPRFEVIGVSVKEDDEESMWFSGPKKAIQKFLNQFDWSNCILVGQNTVFDAAILAWHFDIKPKRIADTMSMARAKYGATLSSVSLKSLAEFFGVGTKGDEVIHALGKRRLDFTSEELARYGEYCVNDVELTYDIFCKMAPDFPQLEFKLIDLTIRMFTEPTLVLDKQTLIDHLTEVKDRKESLLKQALITKENLMSGPKLAETLMSLGVVPPMKVSPTTGKDTYAFAKNDEEFKALLEHENPIVQAIVAARLGVKSTLEESRTERFIQIADRGTLPIPLRYYAAHTGRWGGDDKVNMHNLPRKSPLKKAMRAPDGYLLIDCDSSQIEARTLAWLAGQQDLVEAFDKGEDVYKIMASSIYGKPVDTITEQERFVGKTTILGCLAEGTLVLTDRGWVAIEEVTTSDQLWDGEEWVCHQGLVKKGTKETLSLCGLWLTPDHKVLCGTQWLEAQSVAQDRNTLSLALDTGAVSWLSPGMSRGRGVESLRSSFNVIADNQNTPSINTTSKTLKAPAAFCVVGGRDIESGIGSIFQYSLTPHIESDYSTAYLLPLADAISPVTEHILATEVEASLCVNSGGRTVPSSYDMPRQYPDGITLTTTWIGRIIIEGTNPATSGLSHGQTTTLIEERSVYSRRNLMTYDIAYAGPRNRYTVATDAGPIIVHNCGYGMGPQKFRIQLKTFGVDLPLAECKRIISVYRDTYPMIPKLWREGSDALDAIEAGLTCDFGRKGVLDVSGSDGIILPNTLRVQYPNLRWVAEEDSPGREMVYDTRKGRNWVPNRIYGGKCLAADTALLTERGWVYIAEVSADDRVWDGVEWVNHDGLTYQGKKSTTILNGVRMTPDHEVLTEKGWLRASSCEGLHRADFRMPNGSEVRGDQWEAFHVGVPLHLREGSDTRCGGHREVRSPWRNLLMWVHGWGKEQIARYVETSGVSGMAGNEGSLPATHASGMAQLRRTGYYGMSKVEGFIRGILGGYGSYVYAGTYARPEGQQRGLHPGELPLGDTGSTGTEHALHTPRGLEESIRADGYSALDAPVSVAPEPVYDLLNAGPRSRFVVRGSSGPFIVHNCVENVCQALARIIIGEQMLMIARRYRVAMTVHDSVVVCVPEAQANEARAFIEACMRIQPKWAAGLPLNCESKIGASYGG